MYWSVFYQWTIPEEIHTPSMDGFLGILTGGGVKGYGNPRRRGRGELQAASPITLLLLLSDYSIYQGRIVCFIRDCYVGVLLNHIFCWMFGQKYQEFSYSGFIYQGSIIMCNSHWGPKTSHLLCLNYFDDILHCMHYQGMPLTFSSRSHLTPKSFKVVATNFWILIASM